jgi:hypothetical protein
MLLNSCNINPDGSLRLVIFWELTRYLHICSLVFYIYYILFRVSGGMGKEWERGGKGIHEIYM